MDELTFNTDPILLNDFQVMEDFLLPYSMLLNVSDPPFAYFSFFLGTFGTSAFQVPDDLLST